MIIERTLDDTGTHTFVVTILSQRRSTRPQTFLKYREGKHHITLLFFLEEAIRLRDACYTELYDTPEEGFYLLADNDVHSVQLERCEPPDDVFPYAVDMATSPNEAAALSTYTYMPLSRSGLEQLYQVLAEALPTPTTND